MGIVSEIHDLEQEISRYENYISELEATSETVRREYEIIDAEVSIQNRNYDMTAADEWRGNSERRAEEYQVDQDKNLNIAQEEALSLLSNIKAIIERLREMIRECEHRISELEAMLSSSNNI